YGARARALACFHQPRRAVAVSAPQTTAFPACIRVVDASVETFGIEAQGVGNSQRDHLPVLERDKAITEIGGRVRNILAKPERVVRVDPGVITRLRARVGEAFETGAWIFIERPAFRAVIAG